MNNIVVWVGSLAGCFMWPAHASLLGNIKHPQRVSFYFFKLALVARQMLLLSNIQQATVVYEATTNFESFHLL
jgi:hypothetical protein